MSKSTWGATSMADALGRSNVDYLARMTEMFQQKKNGLPAGMTT